MRKILHLIFSSEFIKTEGGRWKKINVTEEKKHNAGLSFSWYVQIKFVIASRTPCILNVLHLCSGPHYQLGSQHDPYPVINNDVFLVPSHNFKLFICEEMPDILKSMLSGILRTRCRARKCLVHRVCLCPQNFKGYPWKLFPLL